MGPIFPGWRLRSRPTTSPCGATSRCGACSEFRQKSFTNSPTRPLSTGLNGNDKRSVSLQLNKPITSNSVLSVEFDYLDQSTRLPFYTNMSYAASASYRIRYDDPFGDYAISLGELGFCRPRVEQLCISRSVLRDRIDHRRRCSDGPPRHHADLQQPIDAALALWRNSNLAGIAEYRDRAAAGARHHLVEPAALLPTTIPRS